jgi:hypothetical protein
VNPLDGLGDFTINVSSTNSQAAELKNITLVEPLEIVPNVWHHLSMSNPGDSVACFVSKLSII